MQLESFTKKQLIQMIKEQQKSNETERRFYLKKLKNLKENLSVESNVVAIEDRQVEAVKSLKCNTSSKVFLSTN